MQIEKRPCHGWENCYFLSNGKIEMLATSDVGPRIVHLALAGEKNLFRVFEDQTGLTGGDQWRIYGGHRLWHSPEDRMRTYEPDNTPVAAEVLPDGILLRQSVELRTGIEKSVEIRLAAEAPSARVIHRLRNRGTWEVEMAAWALSVMERGGFAVSPLGEEFHEDGLLPNRSIALWPYTEMSDSRFTWGKDHVLVRHDPDRSPTKVGVYNTDGWGAYYLEPFLFLKRFVVDANARYPDFDSTVEIYTNQDMLELETLGPLRRLLPGDEIVHEEVWEVHRLEGLIFSEESVRDLLRPLLNSP